MERKDELKWEWLLCGVYLTEKAEKVYENDKIWLQTPAEKLTWLYNLQI